MGKTDDNRMKENSKGKILVVDDEEALREALGTYLRLEGYEVDVASGAEEAMGMAIGAYNLILLDIMMDGTSGTEMASELKRRPETSSIPIIFLTALQDEEDMVAGLNLGADDYIVKPYSVRNVLARVEAVLRRSKPRKRENVECDRDTLICTVDGAALKLPRKEFEILALLLENPGRIFTREELMRRIWPEGIVVTDRSVDVHVTRIRSKLGNYGSCLVSRSGYGYGWRN